MNPILDLMKRFYLKRAGIFVIAIALIAGMVACDGGDGGEAEPLDHFKWYLAGSAESLDEVVYLEDQFCSIEATVGYAAGFGNPVKKVHGDVTTPISDPDHHLAAYEIYYEEEPETWFVEVENQFGLQELIVSGPYGLAVPTQKEGHQAPVGLDHFLIYEVIDGPSVDVSVSLQDEFDDELQESSVGYPIYFANPVKKTHGSEVTEIVNDEDHLVFYTIDFSFSGEVDIANQFGEQTLEVYTIFETGGLAVPSEKKDHWQEEVYDLTIVADPGEGGTATDLTGASPYPAGTGVSIQAVANPLYRFVSWTAPAGGFADTNAAETTFTMPAQDVTVTAHFETTEPTALVIGTARDTDEYYAIFEQTAAGPVMREFVEQVNLGGGVHLSVYDTDTEECWVPLVLDRREITEVSPGEWDIDDVTQGICDDIAAGDVHFLWGAPGTEFILEQAPIADDAGVVLLTVEGGSAYIRNDSDKLPSWPYAFITLSYSDWYQLPVLADMLEDKLGRTPKAYVVHIEGEHGDDYLGVADSFFDIYHEVEVPLDPGAMDAGEVVNDAMTALGTPSSPNYDIFCGFAYTFHVNELTHAAMVLGFNPPAMVMGPGANFGFYAYMFGGDPLAEPPVPPDPCLVDGILAYTMAAYGTDSEIQDVYDLIAERMDDDAGDPLSGIPGLPGWMQRDYWGAPLYWAAMETWLAAVEEVGYVDQDELKNVLASKNAGDPFTTILGDTWYTMAGGGGGSLDYLCHTGEIGQWQSCGVFETVGPVDAGQPVPGLPNYVVTADFAFPMTGLWNWLPNHDLIYGVPPETASYIGEDVYLEDRFGAVDATVCYTLGFANPVEKVHDGVVTPILHPDNHATGYNITYEGGPGEWLVVVENQFGVQELTVSGPTLLATPAQKLAPFYHDPPVRADHGMSYDVIGGEPVNQVVDLYDEFGDYTEVLVTEPVAFGNPVQKTHDGDVTEILHPNVCWVSYWLYLEYSPMGQVEAVDQFGEQTFDVFGPFMVSVPSQLLYYEQIS